MEFKEEPPSYEDVEKEKMKVNEVTEINWMTERGKEGYLLVNSNIV